MLPYPQIDPVALALGPVEIDLFGLIHTLGPLKIHWYGLM